MAKVIDARGLSCPQPVLLTRKAMAEAGELIVIVDNVTARENISHLARKQGFTVTVDEKSDGIYIHLRREVEPERASAGTPPAGPAVILIPASGIGRGPEELQEVLIRSFLHVLNEVDPLPEAIIFINTGVKLTVEGSPVIEDLKALEEKGVEILICGTCLNYFGLTDKVAVGSISNMYSIAEKLMGAGKVLSL
ncbi:MAG: sulfurtransferase-like selenium metabolism protein YedF [Anaerolineae bacterium]|nr:sulfurtransferase-like selenium metabolism protein YedF [Anaerolineae bacterium]MDW8103081.1 sulfurtransferase-like selenium metabolism protein YedF [Anaerolineae bacterium]